MNPTLESILHLSEEWNSSNRKKPEDITTGSAYMALWTCENNHDYLMRVSHRVSGSGCPYCAGIKAIPGVNDISTTHGDLVDRHWDDTNTLDPREILPRSKKVAVWNCENGHKWEAPIFKVIHEGMKCPHCSNQIVTVGFNDIGTTHSDIIRDFWNPNNSRDFRELSFGSQYVSSWKCVLGHEWDMRVRTFLMRPSCPFCDGRRVLPGFNDICTLSPEFLSMWDYENNTLSPSEIMPNYSNDTYWICEHEHSWTATPRSVIIRGTGCPICSQRERSKGECEITEFVESIGFSCIGNDRTVISPHEIDIFVPSKNVGIEYNGLYWHTEDKKKDVNAHYNKWDKSRKIGTKILTVWEDEWNDKRDLIKTTISDFLEKCDSRIIKSESLALNSSFSENEVLPFLESYHRRYCWSVDRYSCLVSEEGSIYAVSGWNDNSSSSQLQFYCDNGLTSDGLETIVKYEFYKLRPNSNEFILGHSYHEDCDNERYENMGFAHSRELPIDYNFTNYKRRFSSKYLHDMNIDKIDGMGKIWGCGISEYIMIK